MHNGDEHAPKKKEPIFLYPDNVERGTLEPNMVHGLKTVCLH
jgi:hypothetical protein